MHPPHPLNAKSASSPKKGSLSRKIHSMMPMSSRQNKHNPSPTMRNSSTKTNDNKNRASSNSATSPNNKQWAKVSQTVSTCQCHTNFWNLHPRPFEWSSCQDLRSRPWPSSSPSSISFASSFCSFTITQGLRMILHGTVQCFTYKISTFLDWDTTIKFGGLRLAHSSTAISLILYLISSDCKYMVILLNGTMENWKWG